MTLNDMVRGGSVVLWGRDMLSGPAAFAAPPAATDLSPEASAALAFRRATGRLLLNALRESNAAAGGGGTLAAGPPELDALRAGCQCILRHFEDAGAALSSWGGDDCMLRVLLRCLPGHRSGHRALL